MQLQAVVLPFALLLSSAFAAPYYSASASPEEHDATSVGTRTQEPQCRTQYGKGRLGWDVNTSTSTKRVEKDAVYKTTRTTLPLETLTKDITTVVAVETTYVTVTFPGKTVVSTVTEPVMATETSTNTEVETFTAWEYVDRATLYKREQVPVSVNCKQVEVVQTTYIDVITAKRTKTQVYGSTVPITKTVRGGKTEITIDATAYETSYQTTGTTTVVVVEKSTVTVTSTEYVFESSSAAASSYYYQQPSPSSSYYYEPSASAMPPPPPPPPPPVLSDARPDTCPDDGWHMWHCDYPFNIPVCTCFDLGGPPAPAIASSSSVAPSVPSTKPSTPPAPLPEVRPEDCPVDAFHYYFCVYPYGIPVCACVDISSSSVPNHGPEKPGDSSVDCPQTPDFFWYCTYPYGLTICTCLDVGSLDGTTGPSPPPPAPWPSSSASAIPAPPSVPWPSSSASLIPAPPPPAPAPSSKAPPPPPPPPAPSSSAPADPRWSSSASAPVNDSPSSSSYVYQPPPTLDPPPGTDLGIIGSGQYCNTNCIYSYGMPICITFCFD